MDFSIYYWTYKKNIGDYYSCWLLDQILDKKHTYHRSERDVDLVCTGSILEHPSICEDTIICGSGWHNFNPNAVFRGKKENILGVRGTLTRDLLNLPKHTCLGDPGLLISKYYNPDIKPKYKYGVICHWRDDEFFTEKYKDTSIKLIHTDTYDVEAFVNELKECQFIFSTSLHGIIFAHAYGIPAVHLEKTKLESRDNFKFKDYYSVLDIKYKKIEYTDGFKFCDAYNKLGDLQSYAPSAEKITIIQNRLAEMMRLAQLKLVKRYRKIANTNVALCAIAKCENKYIREWVEHYKALKFSKIFLYDNNDIDGEKFEDVIGDYIDNDFVELIDVRGKSNQQIACYDEFYHTKAKDFDWVAYFDIDEFLFIANNMNIKEFINKPRFKLFDGIAFNWKYFDDNGLVSINNNYSVKERFTREYKEEPWQYAQYKFSKRIIRTNLDLVINSSHGPINKAQMHEYATSKDNTIRVCNSEGYEIFNHLHFENSTHNGAYLAHYRFKTIEEYITNKMKRGYPTLYKNSGLDMDLTDFFVLNEITKEKIHKAAQLLNKTDAEVEESIRGVVPRPIKKPANSKKDKPRADGKADCFLYF